VTGDIPQPHLDTLSLTDTGTYVYETVATLEYTGQPVTREQIGRAAKLDDDTLDAMLEDLTGRGLLRQIGPADEPAYEPADRGWSMAPERGQGM
jgi:hypothetical protein